MAGDVDDTRGGHLGHRPVVPRVEVVFVGPVQEHRLLDVVDRLAVHRVHGADDIVERVPGHEPDHLVPRLGRVVDLDAGEVAAMVCEIQPAAEIVAEMMSEAQAVMAASSGPNYGTPKAEVFVGYSYLRAVPAPSDQDVCTW